ncbi:uncharacterized protein LOC128990660 [Macrosteles quadrilineatus]|uniref:uncharacterized protein LOC128990354 n=1 Tax=Macrosteles quadrilineatus TaxID=74068 RepID=UPI0023E1EA90|nr:uncharacterized protein LOC128990354 [Macrosteles quadrilineatus]XP_054269133.1 uncharacterized protein LOC128990660 [Macrosteles quadrilineatus]
MPTIEAYEEFALTVELTVQQLLQAHNYNSVGNLIRFHEEFKNSKETSLVDFMQTYQPPITPEHHTCVGLGLALLNRLTVLDHRFPGLASRLFIVSCEEVVDDYASYILEEPNPNIAEKEHVLVALRLNVAGRKGMLLLDPGYHVARVITVMEDEKYPHTGWFMQSKEGDRQKFFNYTFSASRQYVVWRQKERKGDAPETITHSVIYVARPFLSPVDVTERRNLVYNFRSLLSRNTKGHLTAGIFFPVRANGPGQFTIFYEDNTSKKKVKMDFSDFLGSANKVDESQQQIVEECNRLLGFRRGELNSILHSLAHILSDSDFVSEVLTINKNINEMAEEN